MTGARRTDGEESKGGAAGGGSVDGADAGDRSAADPPGGGLASDSVAPRADGQGSDPEAPAHGARADGLHGDGHRKLEVRGLVKRFRGRRRAGEVVALGGVDLHVDAGEVVALVGTSGCGKSTLLRIIAGLEQPTAGEVLVEGEPVIGPGPDRGMVFQQYSLFPWMTVAGNIAFGLKLAGVPRSRRAERVDELLGIVGLSPHAGRLPRELSGGMRQRVAVARALAPEPDLLLLDEPFAALDAQSRLAMQEFLRTVWQRTGATILLVTHDVDEAVYLSQRAYVLHAHPGRIVEEIAMPFEPGLGPAVKRTPQFLDLRDEIHDRLHDAPDAGDPALAPTPA